jgi:hypothetical protein
MATARDEITFSLRLLHVLDSGEAPTADEASDSLNTLNTLIDSMNVPGLYLYSLTQEALTWPAATASRTIGDSGDFNTTRPIRIAPSTFVVSASTDYPIKILNDRAFYSSIAVKTTTSTIPEYLYYEPTFALGTLYLFPVPSVQITLNLHTQTPLTEFATLDTAFSMPPGYKKLFRFSLAQDLAAIFGVAVPPEVVQGKKEAQALVRRTNAPDIISHLDIPSNARRGYNIYTDQ